jgi:diguanylate cyclase (GGDEF)-like protein
MTDGGAPFPDGVDPDVGNDAKPSGKFKLLARLTLEDPFTGLVNQLLLHDRLGQALMRSKRSGDRVAVFYIEMNYFHDFDEQLGIEAGNAVLSVVVRRLKAIIRSEDTLSRVGGEEFVAVLSLENEKALAPVTKRMRSVFDEPIDIEGLSIMASADFGIVLGDDTDSAEEVLAKADVALATAKRGKHAPPAP